MNKGQDQIELLAGGNTNQVFRKGNVVFRQPMRGSQAVEALLRFLQDEGFSHAPKFLGRDEQGREMLSYIEGQDALKLGGLLPLEILIECTRSMRKMHDLTTKFAFSDYRWANPFPDSSRHDVICHNDFAPYNFIIKDGTFNGVIDFDVCGPGPRTRDLAYFAYWMAPLSFAAEDLRQATEFELTNNCPRLHAICEAYGEVDVTELLQMVQLVLELLGSEENMRNIFDEKTANKLKREGHLSHWQKEARAFAQNKERILQRFA